MRIWYSRLDFQISFVEKIWPKAINFSKKEDFLTLSGNVEGLFSTVELKQSSKETLDYVAHIWHESTFSIRNDSENLS